MVWHFKPHMRAYRFVGHKVEYDTYYAYLAKSNFVNEESIMIAKSFRHHFCHTRSYM